MTANSNSNVGKRGAKRKLKVWTKEQKDAVVAGVHKFGIGKWTEIQEDNPDVLAGRSWVAIRDTWNRLVKKRLATPL